MDFEIVQIEKPEAVNFIFGQSHFIKTVEDLHETLVCAVPGIRFGVAFCEASGNRLVRWSGTDDSMVTLAKENAMRVGAGHSFFIFLGEGFFPINVLNEVKNIPEICSIYCATANPAKVIVAVEGEGRAVVGVFDGEKPVGLLSPLDVCSAVADEKDMSSLTAQDLMSSPVSTVEQNQEVEFALKIMMKYNTLTCPVTESGKLLGVVDYSEVFDKVSKKVAEHGLR